MFGLSMTEVVIILGLALLLLGPDQLPSIAKTLGKGMREIRKATDDLKSTFEQEMVRIDEPEPQRMLQPVSDPAAAKAAARAAPSTPADPASARAAARRAAAGPDAAAAVAPAAPAGGEAGAPALRLVPPEGIVAREAAKLEATNLVEPPPAADAPAPAAPAEGVKDAK
ncbi:MAG TPA: twin-arginine translocase TatA/TatE family subunit [Myxococcales bacterium]